MILLLDTSTSTCRLSFVEGDWRYDTMWEAGRDLSKGLLGFLEQEISFQDKSWEDVTGLVVYKGPGSFTGLRIGIAVFNSIAYSRDLPVVGVTGEDWRTKGVEHILMGEDDKIVLPEYGGEANITKPRK